MPQHKPQLINELTAGELAAKNATLTKAKKASRELFQITQDLGMDLRAYVLERIAEKLKPQGFKQIKCILPDL